MISRLLPPEADAPGSPADAPFAAARPAAARLAWPLAVAGQFLVVFAVVALSSPGRIDIVDGQTRYEVARSLVDHGDSIIRDEAAWFPVFPGRDGKKYTNYRIPHSALGTAAIVLADATGAVDEARRQFYFTLIGPLMAALLAVIYALWFRHLGHAASASVVWGAAGVFCTPSWYYGTSTFDDILGTTGIVFAVAAAALCRDRRPLVGAVLAGLAMAWVVNCKPPVALFGLTVLAAMYRPQRSIRRQLVPAAIVALGAAGGVVFYKAYDAFKFPPDTEQVFADYYKVHGSPVTLNPVPALVSLAFSPACGVLWYCPTLLLSWRGWLVWRERQRLFCLGVLIPSLLFVASICFLPFFKGDPCWGPRYLMPMFALWWLFVPAALRRVRVGVAGGLLVAGVAVQLLGLSVDPMRLFVQRPLDWHYYNYAPLLGFDLTASHLAQRPRELVEVLTSGGPPAPQFNPGPQATHAGAMTTAPQYCASVLGALGGLGPAAPLQAAASILPSQIAQGPVVTQQMVARYHIFQAPRPWIFSHWYLTDDERPMDLTRTISWLTGIGILGLALTVLGSRWQASSSDAPDILLESPLR